MSTQVLCEAGGKMQLTVHSIFGGNSPEEKRRVEHEWAGKAVTLQYWSDTYERR